MLELIPHKKKHIIIFNLIFISLILYSGIKDEWEYTLNEVESVKNQYEQAIYHLGARNKENALFFEDMLKNPPHNYPEAYIPIYRYIATNEFGFNNQIYPDNLINGTMIGYGVPSTRIQDTNYIFPFLDKLWSRSSPLLLSTSQYFVNYQDNFIYMMRNVEHKALNPLQSSTFKPERLRKLALNPNYQERLDEQGYFATRVYPFFFDNTLMMSVITPVHFQGKLIGDMGIDLPIEEFLRITYLPKKIDSYASLTLKMNGVSKPLVLTNPNFSSNFFSFEKTIPLKNFGSIVFQLKLQYFLNALFSNAALFFIALIFTNIALVLYQNKLSENRELAHKSQTDLLSGLFNRRVIETLVAEQIKHCHQFNRPVSILAIDANKFKAINDTYGHDVGDIALKHISTLLTQHTRETDICVRMGGDEFCILTPFSDLKHATNLANRLKKEIAQTPYYYLKDKTPLYISVTITSTQLEMNEVFEQAFKRADILLYQEKKQASSTSLSS